MSQQPTVSQLSLLRLARYHCLLEELQHSDGWQNITSREIAAQLGLSEESVRADLSRVDIKGRPGAGYVARDLHAALGAFLGLSERSPFVVVGSLPMLQALPALFPASDFGMVPIAYFSECEGDAGQVVGDIVVRPLSELASARFEADNLTAVVACDPSHIDEALDALHRAGIKGALMLTPRIRPIHPEGMQVTYFRIPCALKSLAATVISGADEGDTVHSCCSGS